VGLLQVLFLIIALIGLDEPFVSMHFVRQNQTFDVATHVFREGWSAVVTPRASFTQLSSPDDPLSPLITPAPRFTIIHLEVPFHGLFGWPAALLVKDHERAIVRLVSVVFALLSIGVFHLIVRQWIEPQAALAGTALWAMAPFTIYFGQIPMPDMLATTGMALAFLFALRGNLAGSSVAFLFAILAKLSVIIYGLPILTALLIASNCRSIGSFLRITVLWGVVPLLGISAWLSLSRHDPYGSWVVFGGYRPGGYGALTLHDLAHPAFYLSPFVYLLPCGIGIIGAVGLLLAMVNNPPRMNFWLKAAILLSLFCNYSLERIVWLEPQYSVPVLFWVILAASMGLPRLFEKVRGSRPWRIAMVGIVVAHLVLVGATVIFLKSSRVPNYQDLVVAAQLTPPDARLVVYAATPSASPSSWTDRNTLTLHPIPTRTPADFDAIAKQFLSFQEGGFDYLLVFDVEKHHRNIPFDSSAPVYDSDLTEQGSPFRRFCDDRYRKIFEGNHVILYSLVKPM